MFSVECEESGVVQSCATRGQKWVLYLDEPVSLLQTLPQQALPPLAVLSARPPLSVRLLLLLLRLPQLLLGVPEPGRQGADRLGVALLLSLMERLRDQSRRLQPDGAEPSAEFKLEKFSLLDSSSSVIPFQLPASPKYLRNHQTLFLFYLPYCSFSKSY